MDLGHTLVLGFIAGVTIVLGLPIGRLRRPLPRTKLFLHAIAIGILLFLVWDVLTHAWAPIDTALAASHDGTGGLAPAFGYGSLFTVGLAVGLLGLVAYDRHLTRITNSAARGGPGAMALTEPPRGARGVAGWSAARQLALLIAVGIGAAQLCRRSRHRPVGGQQRSRAGHPAGRRIRPAQRDRGFRHRRAAGRGCGRHR